MENSIVTSTVRKSSRLLFYLCLAGIVILFGLLALNWRYFYNFVRGPFPINATQLEELTDVDKRVEYYVTVQADDIAETGYQRVTTLKDGTQEIEASFPVVLVGQKILLIETDQQELDATFTGALKPVSEEVRTNVLERLTNDVPELVDYFLPFMLVEKNFRLNGIIGLAAGFVAFIGLVFGALVAIRRMGNPALHPSLKTLERFGAVDDVIDEIDAEMETAHPVFGNCHLGRKWFFVTHADGVSAARYPDIVWIYKQVSRNQTAGIPGEATPSVVVYDRLGGKITCPGSDAEVDEVLASLAERCPWAVMGYSEESEARWNDAREEFIAEITSRNPDREVPGAEAPVRDEDESPEA